jgi:uncharacterized protein YdeI (YjbR/CyaY-like superfamily)
MRQDFAVALEKAGLAEVHKDLTCSKRKEFARQVTEAKADDTRLRWIEKVIESLKAHSV